MNTDNMAISGETIDYGPCAFMDQYDPATVFSSIDREGRYAYGNQPYIGGWNLARFAETLLPLLDKDKEKAISIAEGALAQYSELYEQNWLNGMRAKLGILNEEQQDKALIEELLVLMNTYHADYTNTFRALTYDKKEENPLYGKEDFNRWYEQWQSRLERQEESNASSRGLMQISNPVVIPRNHRVEEALEAAVEKDDFSVMQKLLQILAKPYTNTPEKDDYCTLPPPSNQPYRTFCGT
jgi:serine/tyrosine/threonine adenylyltransferase